MILNLILGGARSGKSRLAEDIAKQSGLAVTYIATGQAKDDEMAERIKIHQKNRPSNWRLVEEPLSLSDAIADNARTDRLILVDCLTLWLSNLLLHDNSKELWLQEKTKLLELLPTLSSPLILVSNETGLGVVPMGALSRGFIDEAGWLHQDLARICDRVIFTVAGLPTILKGDDL